MIMLKNNYEPLSSAKANELLIKYGKNEIKKKSDNIILVYLKNFYGALPLALEITAIISYLSGDHIETLLIFILLITNSVIAFIQRLKTNRSLEELSAKLSIMVRVNRDNKWQEISSELLVPGDLIRVRTGDIISADLTITEGLVDVDQSLITGESQTSQKTASSKVYSGSIVKRGEATAIVESTGSSTEYGQLTTMIENSHPPTNLEKIVYKIIKYQLIINGFLIIIILFFNFYIQLDLKAFITITIVLLFASIPTAFPTMFIIAQAFGAMEMSKLNHHHGVLVRRLTAVQDAAAMTVLCLDKTGTLTINRPVVSKLITYNKYTEDNLIALAASGSNLADNDPIDIALIQYAKNKHISLYDQVDFSPFDIKIKSTSATIKFDNTKIIITKGLPESIIKQGFNYPDNLEQDLKNLATFGYRVIAIGTTSSVDKSIIGLVALADPLRSDAKSLLQDLMKLSIKIKIITGDNLQTATNIAHQLGLDGGCIKMASAVNDPSLIFSNQTFAEAFPEDKLTIIEALQHTSHVVGMTGDGVNDAPALSQAEVGIAVNNATDIAKNSASLVLSDVGLRDVIETILISRTVDRRIKTWAINKLIKSLQITLLIVFYLFYNKTIIITPLLIIFVFFANDFVTISIASDNTVIDTTPSKWKVKNLIISASLLASALFILLVSSLLLFSFVFHFNLLQIRSAALLLLVFQGQASLYALRSWPNFWSIKPSKTMLISTLMVGIVLILLAIFGVFITAIPLIGIIFIVLISLASLILADIVKHKINI